MMTFEKYLESHFGQSILDNHIRIDQETGECTFPGKLLDDSSFEAEQGTFCTPAKLNVEHVYYKPCDTGLENQGGLAFLLLFKVEFIVFEVEEVSLKEPSQIIRKYYADCTAVIDVGALRDFQMTDIHDRTLMKDLEIEMQRKQGALSRYPVQALTDEQLESRADAFLDKYCPEAKQMPMQVPVRTIFRREFGMELACDGDEKRFTLAREGCRKLWGGTALKLLELLDEKDGIPPFPEAMYHIMNRNAKRTAAGILMPAATLKPIVGSALSVYAEKPEVAGDGELLKCMVYYLAEEYGVSAQAMKIRLEDLGFTIFSGVLNHLDGEYVPAFSTSEENPGKCDGYLIGIGQLKELLSQQPFLMELCEKKQLVYVEGKLTLNHFKYVQEEAGERTLTPYARTHVDECCIRFPGRRKRC